MAGTASRLAISPYCATALKWKAEIGAVAAPATSEVIAIPTMGLANRQPGAVWVCRHQARPRSPSKAATRAIVAAKDIWKPGLHQALRRHASTISAASATARMVSAGRSSSTATSTVAVIT